MWVSPRALLGQIKSDYQRGQTVRALIKALLLCIPGLLLSLLIFVLLVRVGLFGAIPGPKQYTQIKNPVASEIYSTNERLIGKYYYENRTNISYELFPQHLIDALVATEDARFFKHKGLDWRALMRVMLKTIILQDRSGGGGSTLTQQLVKNVFGRKNLGWLSVPVNKTREIFIARGLERVYSKKEILELYMNTVPFGYNFYGLEVAAQRYFGKSAQRLNIEEAATLVGLLKANTYYNPRFHPERSRDRRNVVFKQMHKYGYLNQLEFDSLKLVELKLEFTDENASMGTATHFRQHLRVEIQKILEDVKNDNGEAYDLFSDGLKIYTTIDEGLQSYAEDALEEHMKQLQAEFDKHWQNKKPWQNESNLLAVIKSTKAYKNLKSKGLEHEEILKKMNVKRDMKVVSNGIYVKKHFSPVDSIQFYLSQLRAGFLALEPKTGAVLAWIGGRDYRYDQYDHVLSKRQVGSVFKPVLYYSNFKDGKSPCEFIENSLGTYVDYDDWTPRNSDGNYDGWYSIKGALTKSVNTVSARLILQHSPDKTIESAAELGWRHEIPELPSIALGTMESSLENVLPVYASMVEGRSVPALNFLKRIEDRRGKVLYEAEAEIPDNSVDSLAAALTINCMENVVNKGTASRLRWKYDCRMPIAGKTGTTQSGSDGWFVGCTPDIVAGAWVGGEYPFIHFRSSSLGQGAHMALPIYAKFMRRLQKSKRYNFVNKSRFEPLDSNLLEMLDCPDFLSDSAYQEYQIIKRIEEEIENEEISPVVEEIINIFKSNRKPSSKSSGEKKKRAKKRKEFWDKIFGNN